MSSKINRDTLCLLVKVHGVSKFEVVFLDLFHKNFGWHLIKVYSLKTCTVVLD